VDEPKSLDSLFKEKLFRGPDDYQRGYAWQPEQLRDFWEDLVNLPNGRSHYTDVLTLKEIPSAEARLVVRFGGINYRKADPLSIIKMSPEGSSFEIQAVKPAGSASSGQRQALHFSRATCEAREEHDIWATCR